MGSPRVSIKEEQKGRKKTGFLEDPLWRSRVDGQRASDGKKEEIQE